MLAIVFLTLAGAGLLVPYLVAGWTLLWPTERRLL